MTGEAIIVVSGAVVTLTQLIKWSGLPDKLGPIAVLTLSLIGVAFWGWSSGDFTRTTSFTYFAGWIAVSTSAAGVYGFTRAGGEAVARMTSPPVGGAGQDITKKP